MPQNNEPQFTEVYGENEPKISSLLSDIAEQCEGDILKHIAVLELLFVTIELEMDRLTDLMA
jgi:hypothetical protein